MDKQTVELFVYTGNYIFTTDEVIDLAESWLTLHAENERLQAEAAAMRKALEFYADPKNWGALPGEVDIDKGAAARNALNGTVGKAVPND